jgi:hypothetical protein
MSRLHPLSVTKQAKVLGISRGSVYQSQRGGPRGVSPWVKALHAGSGGLLAT